MPARYHTLLTNKTDFSTQVYHATYSFRGGYVVLYPPEQVHLSWHERVTDVCRHTIMRNDRCDGAQSESRCIPWWSRGNAVE
jgi:hypothetical protein